MEESEASSPLLPQYLWHHRVHEELGEKLFFWRLSFSPVYPRDAVAAGLRAAFAAFGVRSVAVYELFGPFDVLVRVWLPTPDESLAFQGALVEELGPHGLEMCDSFDVDYVVRHWAFKEKNGSDEPSRKAVRQLLEDEETINAYELGSLEFPKAEKLQDEHLAAKPAVKKKQHQTGIKFALLVTGRPAGDDAVVAATGIEEPAPKLNAEDRRAFQDLVAEVVAAAKEIGDRSLYAGAGFGHFVILGRVAYKNFHDIHARLVTQLGSARYRDRFLVGTETLISGQRGMRIFHEQLLRSPFVVPTPSGAPLLDLANLEVGTRVIEDRFEIQKRLGKGGYGFVYKVSDEYEKEMTWALKLFPAKSGKAVQRETEMLRKVSERSKHVVNVKWNGRDPVTAWWYLVSEFIEGTTLETYVRGDRAGQLSDVDSVEIVRQILLGLEAIHPKDVRMDELARIADKRELTGEEWDEWLELGDEGVIHRDVKPLNVMITPERVVKLIDFNIASPAGAPRVTPTSTPSHAPPDGWADRVWAPRVDLFAVGVILYELLCKGKHPYPEEGDEGEEAAIEMIDPVEFRPDLPPEMLDLMRRACTVEGCYSRAVDMREDLQRIWPEVGHAQV